MKGKDYRYYSPIWGYPEEDDRKLCCEKLRELREKGLFRYEGFLEEGPSLYIAIQVGHDSWEGEEVIIKHCPFCGKEVKGEGQVDLDEKVPRRSVRES